MEGKFLGAIENFEGEELSRKISRAQIFNRDDRADSGDLLYMAATLCFMPLFP
jgi:hypothetical protein